MDSFEVWSKQIHPPPPSQDKRSIAVRGSPRCPNEPICLSLTVARQDKEFTPSLADSGGAAAVGF